ncbi:aminoglycoside phosphotransferase family protein [Paenisporosarcina sp. FSL H8-0542]|uniref:phosphotransferase family protein n=1 Tax=Paenisporosarcina sp. FSL H8-0542 TaxID=2921401 RepID=UPI00315B190C
MLEKWIEEATGHRVRRSATLKGGVSSEMTKHELLTGQSVVSRLITNREWLSDEPDLIEHEKQSLLLMECMSVPTPHFISEATPRFEALLMTEIPGKVRLDICNLPTSLNQLAGTLHAIHQTTIPDTFKWTYSSYVDITNVSIPTWTAQQQAWLFAIEFVSSNSPEFQPVLIHRDYHPTNILWEGNELNGVVDWINACKGPSLVDVAHCRINLVMLYGIKIADYFLEAYMQLSNENYTPYWDILAFLDFVDEHLDVYEGWTDSGINDLNQKVLKHRSDEYIQNLIAKLDAF